MSSHPSQAQKDGGQVEEGGEWGFPGSSEDPESRESQVQDTEGTSPTLFRVEVARGETSSAKES